MERTLSLVLDEYGYKSLTLKKGSNIEIDKFTTKFESSEEIRKYFKKEIDEYLEKNKKYIETTYKNKNFRGRIAIIEAREKDGSLELNQKKVLYKKHLIAFKEIIKDKPTMKRFLALERRGVNIFGLKKLVSPFLVKTISYSNYQVVSQVNIIKKEIKRSNNFYDILRLILKAYEMERKERNLKTVDAIYKTDIKEEIEETKEEFFVIDGIRYSIDDIPFDNDQLRYMDSTFIPDGNYEKRIK